MLNSKTKQLFIPGPAGTIEIAVDIPEARWQGHWQGLALVAHPHPLFGGSLDNKVAQTLARTFTQLGYLCVRPNFRGVGASEGSHDDGIGEQQDILTILEWMRKLQHWQQAELLEDDLKQLLTAATPCPIVLGGFSFGAYVSSHVAAHLEQAGTPLSRLVLVGTPCSRWSVAPVHTDTIVIHGEYDETIPLTSVLDWARPQTLPLTIIPGADHFFHRKLHIIKQIIFSMWSTPARM